VVDSCITWVSAFLNERTKEEIEVASGTQYCFKNEHCYLRSFEVLDQYWMNGYISLYYVAFVLILPVLFGKIMLYVFIY